MDNQYPTARVTRRVLFIENPTRKELKHIEAAFCTTVVALAVIAFALMV